MKTTGNNRKKGSNIEDKARDNNLSRDPYKAEQTGEKIISRKIWKIWWVRVLSLLASIVVFCTVYALILPAVAVTEEDAENGSGFYLENGEETPAVTEMAYNGSGEDVQMVSMNVSPVNDGFSGDNSAVNETGSQDQGEGFSGSGDQNQGADIANYVADAGISSGIPENDNAIPSGYFENGNNSNSGNGENGVFAPSGDSNYDDFGTSVNSENGGISEDGNGLIVPENTDGSDSTDGTNNADNADDLNWHDEHSVTDQNNGTENHDAQDLNGTGFPAGFPVNPDSIIGNSSIQPTQEQNPDTFLADQADSQSIFSDAETGEQSESESPVELTVRYHGYDIVLSYFRKDNPEISEDVVFNVDPIDENTAEYESVYPLLRNALWDQSRKASVIHLYQLDLRDGASAISSPAGSNITIRYDAPLVLGAGEALCAAYIDPDTESITIYNTLNTTAANTGSDTVVETASFPFLNNGFVAYVITEELTEADLQVLAQPETTESEELQPETVQSEAEQPETTTSEESQPETVQSEAEQPETTTSEESQPETVQSEAEQPETTTSEESQPETVQSEVEQPETTTSEETHPATTESEEARSEETKAEESRSEETKAEETKSEETKAEETKSEETQPEETKSEETKVEETKSKETKSEETKSEETKAEESKSEETKAEETKSEETQPETAVSETTRPEENKSEADSTLKITGGTTVRLTEVAPEIGIDNVRDVRSIDVEGSDYIQVTKESGSRDWKIESVLPEENSDVEIKDETAELSIKQRDGSVSKTTIEISGEQAMNLTDEGTENNQVVVSSADGKYLPEEAQGTARTLTEEEGSDAVDRVKEFTADDDAVDRTIEQKKSGKRKIKVKKKCYKVFDISLENVNQDDYDQFTVSMDLQESITGTDFKLYHIHDDEVKPLDVKMTSSDTDKSGQDVVSAIEFSTPNFSQFVLTYTVEEEIEVTTYTYHTDEDQFDAAATIAGVAADTSVVYAESESEGLVVSEENPAADAEAAVVNTDDNTANPEDDAADPDAVTAVTAVRFIVTLENGFEDGYLLLETADEEFYEILVVKNTNTIISAANDNYSVTIDFGDSLPKGKYEIGIKQYPAEEEQVSLIEEALTEDLGNGKKKVAHVQDAELLDISILKINKEDGTSSEVEPDGPVKVTLQKGTEVLPTVVHFMDNGNVETLEVEEGNTFITNSFSTFTGSYTVEFEYTDENGNVIKTEDISIVSGKDITLISVLEKLGINTDADNHITDAEITDTDFAVINKEGEPDSWTVEFIKDDVDHRGEKGFLSITLSDEKQDEKKYDIVLVVTGQKEAVSTSEIAKIAAVDGSCLPDEAEAKADVVTGENEEAAVEKVEAAIAAGTTSDTDIRQAATGEETTDEATTDEEKKEDTQEDTKEEENTEQNQDQTDAQTDAQTETQSQTQYRVFDISLKNVDTEAYEGGFKVSVSLPEGIRGASEFQLYHLHENEEPKEIDMTTVGSVDEKTGLEIVSGFEFVTDKFSEFVLRYTVDFTYVDEQGEEHFWQFPGTGSHKISEVLAELGIEAEELTDAQLELVEAVGEFGEKDLYLTQDEDGKWFINSDAAFDDTYELTVVADAKKYIIKVTDAKDVTTTYTVELNIQPGTSLPEYLHVVFLHSYQDIQSEHYTASFRKFYAEKVVEGKSTYTATFNYSVTALGTQSTEVLLACGKQYTEDYQEYMLSKENEGFTQYRNGSIINGKSVTITNNGANSSTITIGDIGPVDYTASINFYEAWSEVPDSSVNLVSPVTLTATTAESSVYTANITGNANPIAFTNASSGTTSKINTSGAITWSLNGTTLTEGNSVTIGDGYVVSAPTRSGTNYVFEARKPVVCTASITVDDASKLLDGYYYVVSRKDSANIGYAQITAAGSLSFTDGTSAVALDDSTTFWIAKSESAFTNLSSVSNAEKIEENGSLGWYDFTIPARADSSNVYIFTATKQPEHSVSLHFKDGQGDIITPALSENVYLVGKVNGVRRYYAQVSGAGSDELTFTDASNAFHTRDLPANLTFALVTSTDNILTTGSEASSITVNGTEYVLSSTHDETNHKYEVNLAENSGYRIVMNYLGVDGQPETGVTLDGSYYVVFKDSVNGKQYYAPLGADGSVDMSAAKDSNNQAATEFNHTFAISETYFVKVASSVQNPDWSNMNVNDNERIKNGGLLGDFKVTYPSNEDGFSYVIEARKQVMYTVRIRFEDGSGNLKTFNGNINQPKLYTAVTKTGVTRFNEEILNLNNISECIRKYNTFKSDQADPRILDYTSDDVVTVILGFDDFCVDKSIGKPQMEQGAIKGKVIESGSVVDGWKFTVTTDAENGITTYLATPVTDIYTVEVNLADANGGAVNTMPGEGYAYVYATLDKVHGSIQKSYYQVKALPGFSDGKATLTFDVFKDTKGNQVAYEPGDAVTVYVINKDEYAGLGDGKVSATTGKIDDGTLVGDYYFTTENTEGKTAFYGKQTSPYGYVVRAVDKDNNLIPIAFNDGPWYVYAEVTREDGTYFYAKQIGTSNTGINENELSGQIGGFYGWKYQNNTFTYLGKTSVIPGENITFGMLRPTDHSPESPNHDSDTLQTDKNPRPDDNANPSNNQYAYFGDSANINVRALNDSSVDNCYTLDIQPGTDGDAGMTVLWLRKPKASTIIVKPYDTETVEDGHLKTATGLTRDDGKYYILGTMTFRDGTEDKMAYVAKELGDSENLACTFEKFACRKQTGVDEDQYLTGSRYYEPSLVFVPNSANLADADAVVNAFKGKSTSALTVYADGMSVEKYRLTATGGTAETPDTEIVLTLLPDLNSESHVVKSDGTPATGLDNASKYYLLAELEKDGVLSYAYRAIEAVDETSKSLGVFKANDNSTHHYAAEDTINFYIVKTATECTSLEDVLKGNRYAENQLTGKYIPSFRLDDDTHTVTATLKEYEVHPVDYNVLVDMLTKEQTAYSEATTIGAALGSDDYYVLAWLTPKGSGGKGQPLAWKVVEIDENALKNGSWSTMIPSVNDAGGETAFAVCDSNRDAISGETVGYDPALFDLNLRLYHSASGVFHTTYNGIRNPQGASKPTDASPTGFDFKGVFSQSKQDELPANATFASAKKDADANTSVIRLHETYEKEYGVKVNVNTAGLGIPEGEYVVRVVLEHENNVGTTGSNETYAFAKLVVDTSLQGISPTALEFYTTEGNKIWHTNNGSTASSPDDVLTGNEKTVRLEIMALLSNNVNYDRWTKALTPPSDYKDSYYVVFMGESINGYTVSQGERQTNEDVTAKKLYIYDVLNFNKDTGTLSKGDLDEDLEDATYFGLYTEDLHLHATDMEANIGAHEVTGQVGADYGFSANNVRVNQIKAVKRYIGKKDGTVELKLYRVKTYNEADGSYVLEDTACSTASSTLTPDGDDGVAEIVFDSLPTGRYVLKEVVDGQEFAYRDGQGGVVETNKNSVIVTFADEIIDVRNINENNNYFYDIKDGVTDLAALIRHSRNATIVVGNQGDYDALKAVNQNTSPIYMEGTQDYPRTFHIPTDMEKLRGLSVELATSASSQTVRVLNTTAEWLNQCNGLKLKDDGRYTVVNIDMTDAGSVAKINVDTILDGHELMADFGQGGREDSSKVLYNFVVKDARGNWTPYTGKISTATQASGVLLAPSATVADLGGNWGGTIVCHRAEHTGSEIHSDSSNKIQKLNTLLTNSTERHTTGALEIQKALVGDVLDNTTYFNFRVTLKNENGESVNGSYTASGLREGTKVTFIDGVAFIQVRANNKVHIAGIPSGYRYEVEEEFDATNNHYQLVHIENENGEDLKSGNIQENTTVIAKAINARKTGGITVLKRVVGDPDGKKKFRFKVTVYKEGSNNEVDTDFDGVYGEMDFKDGIAEFELGGSEYKSVRAKDIPVGRKFRIDELLHDEGGFETTVKVTTVLENTNYSIDSTNKSVSGTIVEGEKAYIVTYTNTHTDGASYTPKVTKRLMQNDAEVEKWPAGLSFSFNIAKKEFIPEDGATMPISTTATATASEKTATFSQIKFTKAGTYSFIVSENIPDDAIKTIDENRKVTYKDASDEQKNGGGFIKDGIEYASDPVTLTVIINLDATTDPDNPRLVVSSVRYGNGADVTEKINEATGTIDNQYDNPTQPYLIDIKIEKVSNGTPLSGAVFKLNKQNGTGQDGSPVWQAVANLNTTNVEGSGQTDEYGKFVVNGNITLNNLRDGTYQIEEITPPAGYVITNSTPVIFTVVKGAVVTDTDSELKPVLASGVTYTVTQAAVEDDPSTDADESKAATPDTFTIPNETGAALPATGGIGTKFYYIFGAAMILFAGALLLLRRKREFGEDTCE